MMLDLIVRNGLVIDGTGSAGRRADIGIAGGRIVEVGDIADQGREVLDASDLVVAPGFVDVHTHYDAQAFWDPTLGPSPLHGVTTVIGGNCGFSIAPLGEESAEYVMHMLARVEGMSIECLAAGVPWDWSSTAEFMDRLEGSLTPNSGWMVGHSALRCAAMGSAASDPSPSAGQLEKMKELLRAGLRAGALGFSSSWAETHSDHLGSPVPSRSAGLDELVALCEVVAEFPGTSVEFVPGSLRFDENTLDVMTAMSVAANRALNWNTLLIDGADDDYIQHQLSAGDYAAARGGRVVALTAADSRHFRVNFNTGYILDTLPGWDRLMSSGREEKLAILRDPAQRAELDRLAKTARGFARMFADWENLLIVETFTPRYEQFVGQDVGTAARALGLSAWDALVEVVVSDDLNTVFMKRDEFQDDKSWARRVELWRDPRTVVGASDAGAHLDMTEAFSYATTLLQIGVRERGLVPIEEAVRLLTSEPAHLYGLTDRGVIRVGAWGDLVIFDADRVAPEAVTSRFDLPGGGSRLYAAAQGVEHVVVAGVEAVRGREFTGARPGRVLRAGHDSATVVAHGGGPRTIDA